MKRTPCRGCRERRVGCHIAGRCPAWDRYQAEVAAHEADRRRQKASAILWGEYVCGRKAAAARKERGHHE